MFFIAITFTDNFDCFVPGKQESIEIKIPEGLLVYLDSDNP